MKIVQHISKAKFKIITPGVANSELMLNFNPVISKFELKGDFYLIHWQARPKGYREWGIYYSLKDTYFSCVNLPRGGYGGFRLLMLDDKTANTIPSAVVCLFGNVPTY